MQPKLTSLQYVGDQYRDFVVTKSIPIPELQSHLRELVHTPSGAQIMHIANEDIENVFCLSFQTIPQNSNGVAHILEHTVLCGSEKFPIKDPFFAMQRRSLNTYMNALTGQDFTCYPAASQVPQDFYNLLEVYLDAVFHPHLNKLSFLQEGHRLEFAIPDNPNTPLEYKGIVFNEMKGAMSSPGARLGEITNRHLYPDITYGHNSGGEPRHIPELSYEELLEFYKTYYHPSRCLFFFYGSLPLERHLDFIHQHALKEAKAVEPLPKIPLQPRFLKPREVIEYYPISPEESVNDKTQIAFGWLTCHILEQETLLDLFILRIALLGTDASPIKLALLRSGLCKEVSSYIESEVSESAFVIITRGCNPENANTIEECLKGVLEKIVKEGLPLDAIESAIHQLEIAKSEIGGDHYPFGLSLFMRCALLKQHGGRAEDGLVIHSLIERIRSHVMEEPQYLVKLIEKYLLNNPHSVRITLCPDPELAAKELAEEKATLDRIRSHLSDKQTQEIVNQAQELAEFQKKQEEEDLDCLPKVTLDDVDRTPRVYDLRKETVGSLQVYHHECFTNEIVYAGLAFDLPEVSEAELPYVSLFSALMSQMGCGGRNYRENLEYIIAHTGGVGASLSLNMQVEDFSHFKPYFHIRGKAIHRKVPKLLALMHDMATSMDFTDVERLREVILKYFTSMENALNQNAIKYAMNLSASHLGVPSKISNTWYGLQQYKLIREFARHFDQHAPYIIEKLQELKHRLLCVDQSHLILSCDEEIYSSMRNSGFYGLDHLACKPGKPWKSNFTIDTFSPQGCIISASVAFCAHVFSTVPYVHPDTAALNLAAGLCDNLTLHRRIREQGGAYGGGAGTNSMAGNFYFYSYRDPNIASTFQAFTDSVKVLENGDFSAEDLEEAKLELLQGMDSPVSPGGRAELAYSWLREGKTFELRKAYRERLLDLQKDHVVEAVKRSLVPNMQAGIPVVFAGKELLEKENAILIEQGRPPLNLVSI